MKIVFADYCGHYYSNTAGTSAPDVLAGKFVQIKKNETEYLVFAPKEFAAYHANLVEQFCKDRGLKGVHGEGKRFVIHDPGWAVVGGGKFEMDKAKKLIRLYDNSMAYCRFESKGLKEKILSIKEFSGYKVQIE